MRYDPTTTLSILTTFMLVPCIYLFSWLDEKASHPLLTFLIRAIGIAGFWVIVGFNFGWFD